MGKDYGETIPYDPLWKGPIEVSRRKTDPAAFKFFLSFLLIWIIIGGVYTFLENPDPNNRNKREIKQEFEAPVWLLIACPLLAGALSLMYIFLLRWWAKAIVYSVIFLIWLVSFASLLLLLVNGQKQQPNKKDQGNTFGAIALSILLVVSIIGVVLFRKKIAIACGIINEASKTAIYFPSHFFLPVITAPLAVLVVMYFVYVTLKVGDYHYDYQNKQLTSGAYITMLYNVLGFWWVWNFVSGIEQMIFSASFSTWYWTMNKQYVPRNTVSNSVSTVSSFHLGTIALGSMIITICQVIKTIIQTLLKRSGEGCGDASRIIMELFSCCCESLMQFIEYVNRNAYIMCAVHGTDFLTSAKNGFNLIMRNVGKVIATTEVTRLVLLAGMLISIGIPTLIAYLQMGPLPKDSDLANKYYITIAVIVMFCIILSSSFFSILQSAIDTIFICAIEDYERNDGTDQKPYYMNYKLKNLLLNE